MKRSIKASLIFLAAAFAVVSSSYIRRHQANVRVEQDRADSDIVKVHIQGINVERKLRLKPVSENIWAKDASFITVGSEVNSFETFNKDHRVYLDTESGSVLGINGQIVNGIVDNLFTIKNEDNSHYLYENDNQIDFRNDVLIPPNSSLNYFPENVKTGGTYTPELLLVIDSAMTSKFKSKNDLYEYLTVFYNGVNFKYSTIKSSTFVIKLVGAVFIDSTSGEPFITDNMVNGPPNSIWGSNTLYSFSKWCQDNKDKLPAYDLAYLMTARNMYDEDNGSPGLAGIAWMGGSCPNRPYMDKGIYYYSSLMGEDMKAAYTGVHTATHEIAHNLGAPHDGSGASAKCEWKDGFIMSYVADSINQMYFSSCSISLMEANAQSSGGSCVSKIDNNNVDSNFGNTDQLPGQKTTLDQVCKNFMGKDTAYCKDKSLCLQTKCEWTDGYWIGWGTYGAPPEGIACEKNGVAGQCKHGVCS